MTSNNGARTEDKTDGNEVAVLSAQLPVEGKTYSPTQSQMQKTSHIRSLYKEYVYIDVGPSKQRFGVHKGLICAKSKFFNAAFNGSFSESLNGVVELVEEDPDIFDIAHVWFYTNELTRSKDGKDGPCSFIQLADLFVLADKLNMPSLCNKAIDDLKSKFSKDTLVPGPALIDTAYTKTPENSPLRKLFVATITFNPRNWPDLITKNREKYLKHPDFLLDVSAALQKQIPPVPAGLADAPFLKDCSFHQHAEGEKDCSGVLVPIRKPQAK